MRYLDFKKAIEEIAEEIDYAELSEIEIQGLKSFIQFIGVMKKKYNLELIQFGEAIYNHDGGFNINCIKLGFKNV